MSIIVKGGSSANLAEVTAAGELKVSSAGVPLLGLGTTLAAVRPDSYLKVAHDASPLLAETFDAALDVTDRWTTAGTAPTSANGTLTLAPGTTALAYSALSSKPTFPLLGNMYNQTLHILRLDSGLKTGTYRFAGLGTVVGSPTVAAPITDGVGFEWLDSTGVLSGVVWSGGVRTLSVSLGAVQSTDGALHRYVVYFKTSRAYFEIDNVSVGSIAFPNPNVANLPLVTMSVNGAATVSPAPVMQAAFVGIGDASRNNHFVSDALFPWRKARIDAAGAQSIVSTAPTITGNGPSSVTAAAADTLLLAANTARRGATVYNDSTAALSLSLGTAAASATAFTVKVPASGYYEVPFGYSGQIRGIWAAANGAARVTEVVAP